MKWTKQEVESLKRDWPAYKSGTVTSIMLGQIYPGRTIQSLSKKYWKLCGRLTKVVKEDPSNFQTPNLF